MSVETAAPTTMVYPMLPSSIGSFTPVTVTVCAVLQFAAVNTSEAVLTVPSLVSRELIGIVTLAVGSESRRTEKVTLPPVSEVVVPEGAETMIAAVSSSWLIKLTSFGLMLL